MALAFFAAGCSSNSLDSASSPSATAGGSDFRQRMNRLFFGPSSGEEAQALAPEGPDPMRECPAADIRSGASTMRIPLGPDTTVNTLRYQATIARLARECRVRGRTMTVKVGVQGRVVMGPAGTPGEVEVPLRYAVIQEGPEPKAIVTKLYRFPVALADGQGSAPFLHVEEDLTFPVPKGAELENYVVYVGFDTGALKESKPPPKKGRSR